MTTMSSGESGWPPGRWKQTPDRRRRAWCAGLLADLTPQGFTSRHERQAGENNRQKLQQRTERAGAVMGMVVMMMSGPGRHSGHGRRHHHGRRRNVDPRQALDRAAWALVGIGASLKDQLSQKSQKNHGDDCKGRQTGLSVQRGRMAGHDARIWRAVRGPVKGAEYGPSLYFCQFPADYGSPEISAGVFDALSGHSRPKRLQYTARPSSA